MDEKTSRLMSQLKDRMIQVSDGQITEIIREARDEALAEAKAIIKDMMVRSILERALGELEGVGRSAVPAGEAVRGSTEASTLSSAEALVKVSADPLETAQAQDMAETKEQIQHELEAIRRQIAENERLLSQVKAPATESEKPREPLVQDEIVTPTDKGEKGHGYYIYGIMKSDGNQITESLPKEGIDPAYPVYALPYQTTQAILSKVSLQEFGQEEIEANLNNINWVEAKVRAHLGILEAVSANGTVIPMRFCTIYQSQSRVQEILEQYYDDLLGTLARLEGKKEWGVKVYCDSEALGQKIGEISDRVKELKTTMAKKSEGIAYFWKKKLEETIAAEVERISDEYAQLSHNRLSSHAAEAVINSLQDKKITGRKEEMILNVAYLVTDEQLAVFRAELESLEKEYGDLGLSYEITGPWPPYNFVTISFGEDVAHESVSS